MPSPFELSHALRFTDAAVEADYLKDRAERDSARAAGLLLALALLLVLLGAILLGVNIRQHTPTSTAWLGLRFGVLVPSLLASAALCRSAWGRARLQLVIGSTVAVAVGAHSLEWFLEWTPAMSLRSLWLTPIAVLWAIAMTLPLNARATAGAALGVLAIATVGIGALIAPRYGAPALVTTAIAYAVCGAGLFLVARWRERDQRALYAHRHAHDRLLAELRAQNGTLQQLVAQRDEFVAGVLHDLRSPLTAVLLGTDRLRLGESLSPASRSAVLDEINRSAKRVDAFANRFLERRSLERAAARPSLAEVPLDPIIDRAVAHAQVSAAHKRQSIQLAAIVPGQSVVADELLLDRALGNLLDNAVKYSPLGAIVNVRIDVAPGPVPRALVAVTDAGPGLSTAEQAHLFQPYPMLGKKPTGGEPSTGLGLSLVKHCIEGMGGAVGCQSEPGRGATFWLTLRRAATSAV
jgi:signal transduction histidine kinase